MKTTAEHSGDACELEAERVADEVMRIPERALENPCACGGTCPVCRGRQEHSQDQNPNTRRLHAQRAEGIPMSPTVREVVRSPGHPLDPGASAFMEARFQTDFAGVRLHTGGAAANSARAVGARAYTLGRDVVFGQGMYSPHSETGMRLIAHELAHVVQQSSGSLRLSREEDQTTANVTQQVIRALNTPDPIAGVGDYVTAYNLLNRLSMPEMLRVLNELAGQFMLDVLISGRGRAQGVDLPRISAAITLVRLANVDAANIQQTDLDSFANDAQSLPSDQQSDMLNFASTARRISAATREGLVAMMAGQMTAAAPGGLSPAVAQGVTGPVNPSPWAPPGGQPIPFYIGNQAHIGIAATYTAAHPGDPVFTNFIPLSTILQQATQLGLTPQTGTLSANSLALKPDILNLAPTRRHLFEIKPTSLQSTARAEARMYIGLLATAGIPVTLGPVGEPGTNGATPAPGGIYLFETPEPGVIVYQYRRQRLVEVPVPVPDVETAREPRFRLAPLTPQQQAAVATTATLGTMMIIMMILLAPVGA